VVSIDLSIGNELSKYRESLTKLPNAIMKIWEKRDYSDEGRNDEIQWRINNGFDVKGYDALSYQLKLWEINCVTTESRMMEHIEYSTDGTALGSNTYERKPTEGWQPISPESFCAAMYKVICPPPNKKR
jgi:hypothetical protein